MLCALFFGSFNPLHYGHIAIAKYLVEECQADQVRLVLSPHNPLKNTEELEDAHIRLAHLSIEVEKICLEWEKFRTKIVVSSAEFYLPKPLYTINTLRYFKKNEPKNDFVLVIGGDNMEILEQWYQWEEIIKEFEIWVYPREGYDAENLCRKYASLEVSRNIRYLADAPLFDISSTEIRSGLKPNHY